MKVALIKGKGGDIGAMLYVTSKTDANLKKACSQIMTRKQNFRDFTDKLVGNFFTRVYNSSCCVDDNMADQLIIFFALGKKNLRMRVQRQRIIDPHS
jgi:RNA 3'-terminal phosphate cyclase